jgi:hypothetical protein
METDKFERLLKALAALAYPRPVNVLPGNAPGWVGLTDEEIKEIWLTGIDRGDDWLDVQGIARAIENALRSRNT